MPLQLQRCKSSPSQQLIRSSHTGRKSCTTHRCNSSAVRTRLFDYLPKRWSFRWRLMANVRLALSWNLDRSIWLAGALVSKTKVAYGWCQIKQTSWHLGWINTPKNGCKWLRRVTSASSTPFTSETRFAHVSLYPFQKLSQVTSYALCEWVRAGRFWKPALYTTTCTLHFSPPLSCFVVAWLAILWDLFRLCLCNYVYYDVESNTG